MTCSSEEEKTNRINETRKLRSQLDELVRRDKQPFGGAPGPAGDRQYAACSLPIWSFRTLCL
jgi:hypothetical protein